MALIRTCDVCETRQARWDTKTKMGPWAYLCEPCHARYAMPHDEALRTDLTKIN